MNLTISGSIVIDLNDDVNYSVVEYAPVVAERRMDGTYGSVDETIRVNIRGTTVSGVTANIKKLLTLAHDAQRYGRTLDDPVSLHYNGYRTTLTRFDVQVPTSFFNYPTMLGVLDTSVSITRKGLFISNTKRDTWRQTTSGISNQVITVTGLSTQPTYAPTDIVVSGIIPLGGTSESYLFCAGRSTVTQSGIVHVYGSNIMLGGTSYTAITDSGRLHPTVVWKSPGYSYIQNIASSAATKLINSYTKTHVFGTVRNTTGVIWGCDLYANTTQDGTNNVPDLMVTLSTGIYPSDGSDTDPHVVYLGTITRSSNTTFRIFAIDFVPNTTPASGSFMFGDLYFVGDDGEAFIIYTDGGQPFSSSLSTYLYDRMYLSNYLSGDPTSITRPAGASAANNLDRPIAYAGQLPITTRSSVIDLAYVATNHGAWRECNGGGGVTTASGLAYVRLTLDRPYATNLVGIE